MYVSEFFAAVKVGDRVRVEEALHEQPNWIAAQNDQGQTPIIVAAFNRHIDLARWLAERHANLSFHEAIITGHYDRVKSMLDGNNELVDQMTPDGFTPLTLAAFFAQPKILELLLEEGADPNLVTKNAMQLRPLHSATAVGDGNMAFQLTKLLLEFGADPNVKQQGGFTPLHAAAAQGNRELVQMLVDQGADAYARNAEGSTPMEIAKNRGHDELSDWLRRKVRG